MSAPQPLDPEAIRQLTMSSDPWLSCDDCFDLLDAVVEDTLTGRAPMQESFRVHLRACAVCRQEAHSLVTLVAPDYGLDPAVAAAQLDLVLADEAEPGR